MNRQPLTRTRGKIQKYGMEDSESGDDSTSEDIDESSGDTTMDEVDDTETDVEYWDHIIASSKVIVKKLFDDFNLPFRDDITREDVLEELVMMIDSFCKKLSEKN